MTRQTPSHHLWASPGVPASSSKDELVVPYVTFDVSVLDFVASVPDKVGDAILEFELPYVCDVRPHEEPEVESWLQYWIDGLDSGEGELASGDSSVLSIQGRCLLGLSALADERPEVCPLLRRQLDYFEKAIATWLRHWPQVEPTREELVRISGRGSSDGGHSAVILELECHSALAFLQNYVPPGSVEITSELAGHFRAVAFVWILKLDSLYGLPVQEQPERVAERRARTPLQLSMLTWSVEEIGELLRCPFFRPQELNLWRLACRWWLEGDGRSTGAVGEEVLSATLLWELLPPQLSLNVTGVAGVPKEEVSGLLSTTLGDDQTLGGHIAGSSFVRVPRHSDHLLGIQDDPAALILMPSSLADGLRCWNIASETQVVGSARQMVASSVPMSSGSGTYRMDFRVVSGVEAEAAHLFEVGLASEPMAGASFKVSGPGAFRPPLPGEENMVSPFFSFLAVPDAVLEGVRISLQVDFDERALLVRKIPTVKGFETDPQPTPLWEWLNARANLKVVRSRPPGEQEDVLFREHAEHLHELIDQGSLHQDLANSVLQDVGAQCVRGAAVLPVPEAYYFYVVVPAGMEVEIY